MGKLALIFGYKSWGGFWTFDRSLWKWGLYVLEVKNTKFYILFIFLAMGNLTQHYSKTKWC